MLNNKPKFLIVGTILILLLLIVSGISPYDRVTWILEVFPVMIGLPIMFYTFKRFPLTNLLYFLIFLHAIVLIFGGIYSYARVPFGFVLQDALSLQRNPYDKIGHFFQGLVPAILAREIFIRQKVVKEGFFLPFLIISVVLAFSALYELIEWVAALILGQGADEFLGTQGDPWDTQSDMFLALLGASFALFFLSKLHTKQILKNSNEKELPFNG
jgi:putative membrane protein